VRIVHAWLSELVEVPADVEAVAREIALRGFEVAGIESGSSAVIDFEVTANRPDCLSHLGFAREASVIWNTPLRSVSRPPDDPAGGVSVAIDVREPALCPRYCARAFDVRIAASPAWLAERLEAAGVRPINNIVDVTNYVMLEIGQPMHAFDLERLGGGRLVIRRAEPGEILRTLDGVQRTLSRDMLVIADEGRAVALAGVMGGADSEIDGRTTRMVLESATFHAPSVRQTSRRLGLKTEASTRFERGADIAAPPAGIARAAALFERIGAGRAAGPLVDIFPAPGTSQQIVLRADRIARLLGQPVAPAEVARILTPLGFGVETRDEAWTVTVPTHRIDVAREADLIEEVGRHVGFDRIPPTFPALDRAQPPPARAIVRERVLRQTLTACGFSEAMTFAFLERDAALPFCPPGTEPNAIANPLSEKYAVLRPSLLPGLVDACAHNRRRAIKDIRLFEIGSRFLPGAAEDRAAAFAWCGAAEPSHWSGSGRSVDFFDASGIVERIAELFGLPIEMVPAERPHLVGGRTAEVRIAGASPLGILGQLAPLLADHRGFPAAEDVYVAEFDLSRLFSGAAGDDLRAEPLPRHPAVVRDLSILVPDVLPAATVRGTIRSSGPPTLVSIVEFDRYSGKGVPQEQISLSLRLTFRAPDRTLTDDEVQAAMESIVVALREAHGAEQR
jgi:phenylalanyl-tRNA synthetase beta chain